MAIRFPKYVQIISGVAGAAAVRQRDLIGRIFTQSPLVSPDSVLEFTSALDVGEFFGTTSDEYRRAVFYFSYISPAVSAPRRISYGRYAPSGAAPGIIGGGPIAALAVLKTATAGVLSFKFNDNPVITVTGINLAAATSLTNVAALITTALNANADPNLSTAVVSFDAIGGNFSLTTSVIGPGKLTIESAGTSPNDLRTALGWSPSAGALLTSGVAAQSVSDAFAASVATSDNFGSFVFNSVLTLEQYIELATLNAGQNIRYMLMVPASVADAPTWAPALLGFQGTAVTLSPIANEYPEMLPMIQEAATDYTKANAVVNYMFKQIGGLTPSVQTDALSDQMDALRVNYYGRTQTAGQNLDFYQRGVLMGGPTAPVDMNVYANEQWLKDALGAKLMALLLSTGRVPANAAGRSQVLGVAQSVIDQALKNGTISVGKELTVLQQLFITQQTNDPRAWYQVQSIGYWVDAVIVPYAGPSGPTEYKVVYTLIYSKDDAIRFVDGLHFLV